MPGYLMGVHRRDNSKTLQENMHHGEVSHVVISRIHSLWIFIFNDGRNVRAARPEIGCHSMSP